MTLLTIPMILTGALSTALVPAISEASARGQQKEMQKRCSEALRITYIFSIPIIAILFFQGENLAKLLFHIEGIGSVLQILSLGGIFLYLISTTIGIMQGLGLTKAVFINNLASAVTKLVCIYYFAALEQMGLQGIALSFVLSYVVQCLLNLLTILKIVDIRLSFGEIIIPFGLCGLMLCYFNVFSAKLQWLFADNALLLTATITAGLFYFVLILATKQFSLTMLK